MLVDTISEAEQRVQRLQYQVEDLDQRLSEAQSELEAIDLSHQDGAGVLSKAQEQVARLENEHVCARSYAALKHGKAGSKQALADVTTAKKALDVAQDELDRLLALQAEARQRDNQRGQELHTLIDQLGKEKAACLAEIDSISPGLKRARAEYGKSRYDEFLRAYQEKQSHVDAITGELIDSKVALLSMYEQGVQDLAAWPELQREASRLQPADNANLRALEATEHYVTVFLREAKQLSDLPKDFMRRGYNLWDLVLVTPGELQTASRYPDYLKQRQTRLEAVISEYSAYLANGDDK